MKLEEMLREHEDTILRIKTRLYFLMEFEKQFKEISRDKKFKIRNDIVWHLIYDAWDMLVIDLASLSKGMLGTGGFFNQIKANLNEVKSIKKKDIEKPKRTTQFIGYDPTEEEKERINVEMDDYYARMLLEGNREALFALFPKAKDRGQPIKINHQDVDELKERFEQIITDVVDDRNKNRAHKYEQLSDKKTYERLNFGKLNDKFTQLEKMLNQIRSVVSNSSFAYSDMNLANKEETSKDLITMIMWGTNKLIDFNSGINEQLNMGNTNPLGQRWGWVLRKELIEKSHEYHDRIIKGDLKLDPEEDYSGSDFCFNDVSLDAMKKKGV